MRWRWSAAPSAYHRLLTFFTGTEVGLQGYQALNQIGTIGVHRLHLRVLQHPRDRAAGRRLALSATVGCGFTAQLGAMRISEEVDALEVMAVPSLPFLVTTRMIAGLRSRSSRCT